MTRLLRIGGAAGASGGLALALTLLVLGEGPLERAIALEPAGGPGSEELFGRGVQVAGGALGAVLYGVAVGLAFAVAFARLRHRMSTTTDARRSMRLAAAGFVAIVLVPFVLYPPNPPGVGDPDTINQRTAEYLLAVAFSIVALVAAARLYRQLRSRGWSEIGGLPVAVGAHVAIVSLAAFVLPGAPAADSVPAEVVWDFRLASLAGAAALWFVTGLVFGWRASAALSPPEEDPAHEEPAHA